MVQQDVFFSSCLLLWRRCEVWTRPAGIQATREVAGYQCLEAWAARVGPFFHPSPGCVDSLFWMPSVCQPCRSANSTYSAGLLGIRLELHVEQLDFHVNTPCPFPHHPSHFDIIFFQVIVHPFFCACFLKASPLYLASWCFFMLLKMRNSTLIKIMIMTERMTDFFPLLQRLGTRSRLSCYLYTMRITKWLKASEPVSCCATLISLCFSVGDIQPRGRRGECLSRDLSGWQYARATWFALVFTKRATFRDPDSTLPEDAGFTVDHVMSCSHLCTTFCTSASFTTSLIMSIAQMKSPSV